MIRNILKKENGDMTNIGRILKLFINPEKSMNDVAERPNSYPAIFILLAFMIAFTVITFDEVHSVTLEKQYSKIEIKKDNGEIQTPKDELEMQKLANVVAETRPLIPIIFRLLKIFFFALYAMYFFGIVYKVRVRFRDYLAVVSHGALIFCIGIVFSIITYKITNDFILAENITKLKVFFPDEDGLTRMGKFSSYIDILTIISLLVTGYGLKAITDLDKKNILAFIVVTYIIYIMFGIFVSINIQFN